MIQPHGRAEGESETRDRLTNPFFERLHKIDCHRFSAKEGAQRPEQARPRTNIQVHFNSFGPDKFLTSKIRASMESLGREKVRPMGNIAPKRAFDQVKQDPRPTSRWGRKTFQRLLFFPSLLAGLRGRAKHRTGKNFCSSLLFLLIIFFQLFTFSFSFWDDCHIRHLQIQR